MLEAMREGRVRSGPRPVRGEAAGRTEAAAGGAGGARPSSARLAPAPVQRREALPSALRRRFEAKGGVDLGGVTVDYDSPHPARYGAAAYTRGTEIHLAPGEEHNLAHEAWHAVQQAQGRVGARGRVGGAPLNDDPKLEGEADRMAEGASPAKGPVQRFGPPAAGALAVPAATKAPMQRLITITGKGGKTYQKGATPPRWMLKATGGRAAYEKLVNSDFHYKFEGKSRYHEAANEMDKRQRWWKDRRGPDYQTRTLHPHDPKFQKLEAEILNNHDENPYSIDALHEGSPLMKAYMSGDRSTMLKTALSPSMWMNKKPTDRPNLDLTKIDMIKNKKVIKSYENARREMSKRTSSNERYLYSGHGNAGMDHIAEHGHDPAYGQYDPGGYFLPSKGHGAHGRGSYFTDQVDKALSYSGVTQGRTEQRSFYRQKVLLGHSYPYEERGRFRHRHHNEMVRADRNPVNRTLDPSQGTSQAPGERMERYDSLVGTKRYEPGAGLIGTYRNSNKFDSNEYMVRNADQILPKYRVYYNNK